MKIRNQVLLGMVAVLAGIQFFRPEQNAGTVQGRQHISKVVTVPAPVEGILQAACYDCHSNHTNYPWYAQVQPVAWWLNDHVVEGKDELNFSEFAGYKPKRQRHKLEEIAEQVKDHEMPLKSYELVHPIAVLSESQINELVKWAMEARSTIQE